MIKYILQLVEKLFPAQIYKLEEYSIKQVTLK